MIQSQFQAPRGASRPLVLDMTPDGQFRAPRRPSFGLRLVVGSVLLAVVAGAAAIMALALWVAMALIPIAIAAAVVAYVAVRVRRWRAGSALFRGQGGLGRPFRS